MFKAVIQALIKKYFYYIIFLSLGLIIFFYPMLKSGFDLMPGDGYGINSFNYLLEHSWLWVNEITPHKFFWSPPVYYPNSNTLAYTDTLMGLMPIYWFIRMFFEDCFTSFQLMLLVASILNFTTFYCFLNKQLKFSDLASSVASFIFAFSIMRTFRMDDVGYFSQFYSILSIIFLTKVNKNNPHMVNHRYFIISTFFMIIQLYTCFSLGFFTFFVAFFALAIALLPKTGRDCLINFFSNHYKMFLFYLSVIILMLAPLSYHFVLNGTIRTINDVVGNIQSNIIWIRNVSILDSIFFKKIFYAGAMTSSEVSASLGIFTTILAFIGLWKLKYSKGLPIILIFVIYLVSCNMSAMRFWSIFYYIPGVESMQSITRISFIVLIILSLGACALIQYFSEKTFINKKITKIALFIVILLFVAEQVPFMNDPNSAWKNYSWSKSEYKKEIKTYSGIIPKQCNVIGFNYVPVNYEKYGAGDIEVKNFKKQVLENNMAMWLGLTKHVYTMDGYFGILLPRAEKYPKDYCFFSETIDYEKI